MPIEFFCSLPGTGVTGGGVGVGAIKRFSAVRWGVTKKILYTWIFTLPGTALLASLIYLIGIRFS